MSDWQPIDTAPQNGTRFLAFVPGDDLDLPVIGVAFWDAGSPSVRFEATKDPNLWRREIIENGHFVMEGGWYSPTHWMPLPEPPRPAPETVPASAEQTSAGQPKP